MDVLPVLLILAVIFLFLIIISYWMSKILKIPAIVIFLIILFTGGLGLIIFLIWTLMVLSEDRGMEKTKHLSPVKKGKTKK